MTWMNEQRLIPWKNLMNIMASCNQSSWSLCDHMAMTQMTKYSQKYAPGSSLSTSRIWILYGVSRLVVNSSKVVFAYREEQVYRASMPGLSVRVYVMMWDTSAEEDKYLAEVRREKESFEKLIKERAVSLSNMPLGRFIYSTAEYGSRVTREPKSRSGSHRSYDPQYQQS